ncbi:MAG: hypothetical protein HOL65_04750 [Microbacteriaceae bacterium]|nr:hypothetical protein [Microbacteriaceae bacterium]
MRLIVAIVLWVVSIVSLTWGIAQRTVFDAPDSIVRTISLDNKAPATILRGNDLLAFPGRPTITISGTIGARVPAESGVGFEIRKPSELFVAYGRSPDVLAWLSPTRHTVLSFDALSDSWTALPRSGELFAPDPRGSDMWLQEFSGTSSLSLALAAPEDMTLLIMSDGVLPAPTDVTITWPVSNDAPLVLAAIIVGVITLIAGFIAVLTALVHYRNNKGPRRKKTRMPKRPRRSRTRVAPKRKPAPPRGGRRVAGFVALPLVGGLLLGGCSPVTTPPAASEVTEAPVLATKPYPAVTELQFSRIMSSVAAQIRLADEELSINLLGPRVQDPMLSTRGTAYIVQRADPESSALVPIPSSPIRLVMPQQTTGWPRSVFGIIQDEEDLESPSLGVVLRQEDPRSQYHLTYAVVLNPQVQLPDLPAANIGAPKLAPDSKLTRISPQDVVAHYSQVINEGTQSEYAREFSLAADPLFAAIGPDAALLRQESFGETVEVDWETTPTDRDVVAFSTAAGGAIVLGTLSEAEKVMPIQSGATINSSIAVRALTSLSQSSRGFEVDSHIQILWYVPPVGSEKSIRVLGFTYSLMGAKEVSNE